MNGQSPIRIGMVLFPKLTQLDLTGPYEVLNSHPRTRIDLLWHRLEPIEAQGGLILTPSAAFGDYGRPDVLFVPGGPGVLDAMDDEPLLDFIRGAAERTPNTLRRCAPAPWCLPRRGCSSASARPAIGVPFTCWNSWARRR